MSARERYRAAVCIVLGVIALVLITLPEIGPIRCMVPVPYHCDPKPQ